MNMWKRIKSYLSTPIPGDITAACLVGTLLGTFTVLCITLPMSKTEDSTLDASTFGKNESLDLVLKMENGVELHLKATGATTMDLVQSLNRMLKNTEGTPLGELY